MLKPPPPDIIKATCAEYFGVYRTGGRWSPPNRCGSCPIRIPCSAHCHCIARDNNELDESRRVFHAAALAILTPTKETST